MLAELALLQQLLEMLFLYIIRMHVCMHVSILERRDCRLSSAQKQFSWFDLEIRDLHNGVKTAA